MSDNSPGSLSFAADIRPMFRERDRDAMRSAFDLWSADDVVAHGEAIIAQLSAGSMPCDVPWTKDQIDQLRAWLTDRALP